MPVHYNQLSTVNSSISTQVSTLTSTLNSTKSNLQSQINSVKNTANNKLSSTSSSQWFKIYDPQSKRTLIVQWGEYTRDKKDYTTYTYTFPTAFTGTANV